MKRLVRVPYVDSDSLNSFLAPMLLAVLLLAPQACVAKNNDTPYKILCLGDSITHAETSQASYRYPLWKKLIDADISFDYVGTMTRNRGKGEPPHPDYKGRQFDKDHEGHFAWRVDEVLNGVPYTPDTGSGSLKDWLETYDVDIALVHLGTNDAFHRQSNDSTREELKAIVGTLRLDNPQVVVMLAQVIPTSRSPGDAAAVVALNGVIQDVVTELHVEHAPVILVDQFSGFDAATDTYDAVHPNAAGEEKMAQRWFEAIKAYVDTR